MAARISRSLPSRETGLMPMPQSSGKRIRLELDARVDVLGVLPEDHHVHLLRVLHRAGDALEVPDGPEADVEVEQLTERNVQAPDAAAHRRG